MRTLGGFVSMGVLASLMWGSLLAQTPGGKVVELPVAEPARPPQAVPVQFGIIQPADVAAPERDGESDEAGSQQIAEEIRQRLHDPVSITMEQVPLKDALHELLTKRKFDFWLDEAALGEAQKKVDEIEVTCELHHVSARAALERICRPAGLGWVCEDAGIRITSRKNAAETLFHRIYDVTTLLTEPEVKVEETPPQKLSDPVSNRVGGLPRPVNYAQFFGSPTGGVAAKNRGDVLIQLVQGVTGGPPDHPWMEADGEGGSIYLMQTAHMVLLVIRMNEPTHAEIERLLNELTSHQHAAMGEVEEKEEPAAPKDASRKIVRPKVRIVGKRAQR